jgi:hypothetical protein
MFLNRRRNAVVIFALFLILSIPGLAQDRGTIRGTVTDQSDAPVPESTVTVKNVNTGLTQTVKTGADGVYTVLYLPVGNYSVTTDKTGFRKAETTGVRVDVAVVVDVDVKLTVAGVDQSIDVSAAAPLLETTGSNLGKVLPTKAISDLPLFISGGSVRSNLAFVILTPGVIGPANNPRIGGGLLDGQSEQLDGAESNSERRNDPAMNGVSVEGMEEFKVQSSAYSAEFGRTSNGVINWVTKSGTNQVHGSAFVFNRNEVFNDRGFTFTASKKPIVRQWNPGGSFGGPIYIPKVFDGRNKAFFFFAYERASTRNGQSTSLASLPVDEYRIGDMRRNVNAAGQTIPLYDPFDANGKIITDATQRPRMQCNGVLDVICPSRIDPIAKLNMALLPEPDNPNLIVNNYRSRSYSTSKSALPSIKLDYVLTDKQRISFLYSHFYSPATPSINTFQGVPGTGFPSEQLVEYYRLNHDYTITPNLLNHLAIGYNHRHIIEAPGYVSLAPADWAKATYIPGTVTPLAPGTSSTYSAGGVTWGNSVFTDSRQRTTNFKEQVAWLKGRHTVKFGMDYLRGIYRRLDYNGAYGSVSFSAAGTGLSGNANTGSDWASFLLGVASGGSFRYPDDTAFYWPYYAWYIQDDFKVSKKLTLNIGLRYEIPVPKEERHHHNSNFCPTCPNAAAGGLPGAMVYAGVNGAPGRFGETRMNGFGPRLGLAYQLDSKTVIRAGGSIYYQPSREDGNADNGIQGFGGTFGAIGNALSNGISYQVKDGFTSFAPQIAALRPPISDPATLSANLINQTPFYYNPTAGRAPYFGDWNFTIERTVTANSIFRASYHATIGNKLLSRQQSQNQLDPRYWGIYGDLLNQSVSTLLNSPSSSAILNANGFKLPFPGFSTALTLDRALRPFPQYSGIDSNAGGQNDGHMTFHALETSFEHRFNKGLYILVSYTFCKLISGSNGEDANRTSDGAVQNQYNRRMDKAVASQDTPHNLRVSYVYELPIGKGKQLLGNMHPVLNAVIGNWKVSAIHTYVSGTPFVISCNQNFYGAGSAARCSFAPGVSTGSIPLINPTWSSDKSVAFAVPYLNPAAFVVPPNMVYGDTPRRMSYLRSPWTVQEDMSILKNFNVTEKVRLEVRGSAQNALNRALLAGPDTNMSLNNVNRGKITTAQGNGPRNIQLGARISF